MTDHEGLKSRVQNMLRASGARVLDELKANPVSFVVIVAATAISYESLFKVPYEGLAMPWILSMLFPLVLDVAAYPALTTLTNRAMGFGARVFAFFVSLFALAGSLYGNFARHLAEAALTAPWAVEYAAKLAWTYVGTVPGTDPGEFTAITSPSPTAIIFVSVTVPLAIVTTIVLSLFKPKAKKAPKRVQETPKATRLAPPSAEPGPTKREVDDALTPKPSSINTVTVGAQQREFIRGYHSEHGDFPTIEQVNTKVPDPHRNTHKVLDAMKKKIAAELAEKEETG